MPDVFAAGSARAGTTLLFSWDCGNMTRRAGLPLAERLLHVTASRVSGSHWLRLVVEACAGETREQLGARAVAHLDELERIAETVAQTWPRLDGETPSPAEHWLAAGFADVDVIAWLEAGVPWSTSAAQLRGVGITPRDVARELEQGWSLGLIFARGDLTLAEVQRLVCGEEAP